MKINNAKISILIGDESTTIELIDSDGAGMFARAKLTNQQLALALGRLSYCDCDIDVYKLQHVGKTLETKAHEFEIPNDASREAVIELCDSTKPDGWIADTYYGSQNSFFTKDGKRYARTTIRRWV